MIRLADLPVDWQDDRLSFVQKFLTTDVCEPVINIEFSNKMAECHSVQYADIADGHILRSPKGDLLIAQRDWKTATSYFLPEDDKDYALVLAALCSRFAYYDTLLLHSSFIEYCGKGLIFTGYSGVGKTTQAELWSKYFNAEIVNGDKTFIREVDGNFCAYGLPWKGSSDYCLNKKALLSGIVVLRQSNKNRITRLNDNVVEYLMPHIFLPHWDNDCLNKALDTYDKLIGKVPVWLLECRPDKESVEITRDAVFG